VIRTLYGSKLAAELVALECSKGDITKQNANDASDHVSFNTLQCKIKGYISNPNYKYVDKKNFILYKSSGMSKTLNCMEIVS
jgi:hypothetical protein